MTDMIDAGTPKIYRIYQDTELRRYLITFYYMVLACSGNEEGPRTHAEIIFIFITLMACMFGMNIFIAYIKFFVTNMKQKDMYF